MSKTTDVIDIKAKSANILAAASDEQRYLVAVVGPPASGKSTLADQLSAEINAQANRDMSIVVPMDGFHLDNSILDQRGIRHLKGAPQTFDSDGFVAMVKHLASTTQDTIIPLFDRSLDKVIVEGKRVASSHNILILEGNYLLLKQQPWADLYALYTDVVFLNPGMDVLEERLIARWLHYGLSEEAAQQKARLNDIPNAELVLRESRV